MRHCTVTVSRSRYVEHFALMPLQENEESRVARQPFFSLN
jgi:hypothetical protein